MNKVLFVSTKPQVMPTGAQNRESECGCCEEDEAADLAFAFEMFGRVLRHFLLYSHVRRV